MFLHSHLHFLQWMQLVYFSLALLSDVVPRSSAKLWLQKLCDVFFTVYALPSALVGRARVCVYIIVVYIIIFPEAHYTPSLVLLIERHFFHLQFVAITFWSIYAVDRELIYPARLDEHIPTILNHFWVRVLFACLYSFQTTPPVCMPAVAKSHAERLQSVHAEDLKECTRKTISLSSVYLYTSLSDPLTPPTISILCCTAYFSCAWCHY